MVPSKLWSSELPKILNCFFLGHAFRQPREWSFASFATQQFTQPNSQPELKWLLSEFVEQDCHLTYVEEDVVLACIRYIGGKVLTNYAVPVWGVLFIEETLYVFRDLLFSFFLIYCTIHLLLHVVLHVLIHFTDHPGHITLCHFSNYIYFLVLSLIL